MSQRQLRHDSAGSIMTARLAAGVSVASSCQKMRAVLIESRRRGLESQVTILATTCMTMDESLVARLCKLASITKNDISAETLGQVRAELAEIEVEALQRLAAEATVALNKILVVGVDDPGWWSTSGVAPSCISLCDAARVAEASGISVVDNFAARDLAQSGQGGPLRALPQWILLRHPTENRLLVDLGRTTRMTFLPGENCSMATSHILSFDVGPGTWLLDDLATRLTSGQHRFDPGGRFAVQGKRLDTLLEHWLSDHTFSRSSPRWHPRGVRPERFLNDAVTMAIESDWSVRDLLCTATHLIAESIARSIRDRLPNDLAIDRIVVTGGGQHNGMLLREIASRLPQVGLSLLNELNIKDDALSATCAALLALFHLDQIPGNIRSVTGAEVPRVLGRLTPGSPQSWQNLVHHMAGAEPSLRTLRSAL